MYARNLGPVGVACALLVWATVSAAAYTITKEQVDAKQIYFGKAESFEKAGAVDFAKLMKATPEFQKLEKEKVELGSGQFYILLNQASTRVKKAITEVGKSTEYDLIAEKSYLGSLDPEIPADDLTEIVLKTLDRDVDKVAKAPAHRRHGRDADEE